MLSHHRILLIQNSHKANNFTRKQYLQAKIAEVKFKFHFHKAPNSKTEPKHVFNLGKMHHLLHHASQKP
jgi:hypothetical protein